ncbi:acyltransferase [Mastigocoleus sp. MO_188.B34]|uniref:acyltransferase n=1 Tax=Mastigocoleus sp. MO_188.B34 TaxID=3036635 RepID=UPI002602AA99|nr:acyltransferase [Mastigocoleus sp. MO_188.B34]MDJ0696974.1 acyltransferase [Mastigocoleus sp. MO_188.B34]
MGHIDKSVKKSLALIYFAAKRFFYKLRYPNVKTASDVAIKGSLIVKGNVRVNIGSGSRLGKKVTIYGCGDINIGSNVFLNGCCIGCQHSISIGDDCLISDCYIADSDYHNLEPLLRHSPPGEKVTAPIIIKRNVWVGARATIMKGVNVGEDSVIGLGSVVRKSVPPSVVVIGNPQQIVKHFNQ